MVPRSSDANRRTAASARSIARQRRLLAEGRCRCCGAEPRSGQTLCEVCAQKNTARSKRLRDARQDCGLCNCGGIPRPNRKTCEACATESNERHRVFNTQVRKEVFDHYGGAVCACCGETIEVFLEIDHINGGGNQHRRNETFARSIYKWLKANGFPPGFRVLCSNCNRAHGKLGYCPHQRKEQSHAEVS